MMRPTVSAIPALVSVLAIGIALGGCAAATAPAGAAVDSSASSPTASAAKASFYGPTGPDPACAAARKAEQTLQARQGKDQSSESAIDQDFTNFASALNAAARQEKHPAAANAMTALANDYTALVESQSGAAPLPSMSAVQNDGAAFDRACP
jgi:hypothetical protein